MKITSRRLILAGNTSLLAISVSLFGIGCSENSPAVKTDSAKPAVAEIGEFDPNDGQEVVEIKPQVTDPITGPLAILKGVRAKMPALQIEHALNLYQASEGNFPKSHDEFMTNIIKANNLALPQLTDDLQYRYDVENHKLVIVRTADGKIVE